MGLSMYGDPDALDALAHRLGARAAEIRERADDHVRTGMTARWVSAAADDYRDRIMMDRQNVEEVAASLDHAAAVLRAHAQQIRELAAKIAEYEQAATEWFEKQARSLADTVGDAIDSAQRTLKRLVTDPPWKTWPIGPGTLPASGDMKWLEVGRFMRGQGVL